MAKDKSEKKERKEKKDKHTDDNKKIKKEKKEKKRRSSDVDVTTKLEKALKEKKDLPVRQKDEDGEDVDMEGGEAQVAVRLVGQLVPFANPLADEKGRKKIMKGVKKAAKQRCLKRGVKEVVKTIRKSPSSAPASSFSQPPIGVAILAADISPMDVISHLPVLCEDHNIPYIYVESRAELGAASSTKRPTSVVMLMKDKGKKRDKVAEGDEEADKEYAEAYNELVKMVQKATKSVKV